MTDIRIPRHFYDDHYERDLPSPGIKSVWRRHYIINSSDPALPELLSDAKHYAEGGIDNLPEYLGLISSARATVRAITQTLEMSRKWKQL